MRVLGRRDPSQRIVAMPWPVCALILASCGTSCAHANHRPVETEQHGEGGRLQGQATTPQAQADGANNTPVTVTPRILPAGVYWHSQAFGGCDDDECPVPSAAVVAGGSMSVSTALRRARQYHTGSLAIGYPLLAHTDELGNPPSVGVGVLVMLGLFATDAEANAFRLAQQETTRLRILQVSDPYQRHPYGWHPRQVIRIDQRGAQAYSAAEVERIERRLGYSPEGLRAFSRMQPMCRLDAGTAFVVDDPYVGAGAMWVPVRCGARPAYTHVTDLLFRAVVLTEPDGTARLVQVVNVECDMADLETWRHTRDGREPVPSQNTRFAGAVVGG